MDKCLRKILINIRSHHANCIRRSIQTMASQLPHPAPQESYEDAIRLLNSLQSNAQIRAEWAAKRQERLNDIIPDARKSLDLAGVSQQWLDTLNVIHVSGTKGKGTTCAFTESILRSAGLKTGFFSSPHLVEVRERIKINGKPISNEKFAHYFFKIYNRLAPHHPDPPIPPYFRFLMNMAFYAFLSEKVDVAIVEVGIGGTYDSTNVVSPTVVGITSLGLEHQPLLGQKLEEIAMHKAGIMKRGVPAFTVYNHENYILDLLQSHASTVKCPLYVVPSLNKFSSQIRLSVDDGNVSRTNAALAVQLANSFLAQKRPDLLKAFQNFHWKNNGISTSLLPFHLKGLESAVWKGRFQIIQKSEVLQYFLDGAHTRESVSVVLEWFRKTCSNDSLRVLVFNVTGERGGTEFFKQFASADMFNLVIFCPIQRRQQGESSDNWSALSEGDISKTHALCKQWESMGSGAKGVVMEDVDSVIEFLEKLSHKREKSSPIPFKNTSSSNCDNYDVLVTGSLHLVGTFLSVLDPYINN